MQTQEIKTIGFFQHATRTIADLDAAIAIVATTNTNAFGPAGEVADVVDCIEVQSLSPYFFHA